MNLKNTNKNYAIQYFQVSIVIIMDDGESDVAKIPHAIINFHK